GQHRYELRGLRLRAALVVRGERRLREEPVAGRVAVGARDRGGEQRDDDHGGDPRDERPDGCEQPEPHPLARSTTGALTGGPPFGVTLNVSPQWPTMTSAGAGREYVPGEVSVSWYSWLPISMSSMANVTVTFAPVTGRPFFVIWSANLLGAAALFGCTSTFSVYGPWWTTEATGPGPTFASALLSSPRNFDGGARLERSAAANTAAVTITASAE